MSRKGGYKILDFKGTPLTSGAGTKIDGIAERLGTGNEKATLISGLVVGDITYPDFFAPFIEGSETIDTTVVIGSNTIKITIAPDDTVTATVTEA